MRRASKIDGNHVEIVALLRKLGASVVSLAAVGKGCPDLAVAYRGRTHLVEIKNGKQGRLTPDQREFRALWNDTVVILDSIETTVLWLKCRNKHDRCNLTN